MQQPNYYQEVATRNICCLFWHSYIDCQFVSKLNSRCWWLILMLSMTWDLYIWKVISICLSLCASCGCQAAFCWQSHHLGWPIWHWPMHEPSSHGCCFLEGAPWRSWGHPWRSLGGATRPACLLEFLRGFERKASFKGRKIFGVVILFSVLVGDIFNYYCKPSCSMRGERYKHLINK